MHPRARSVLVLAAVAAVVAAPLAGVASSTAAARTASATDHGGQPALDGVSDTYGEDASARQFGTDADGTGGADATRYGAGRVVTQEGDDGDESQEGDGGAANGTENATRSETRIPGPDIGSATVTVLRTPTVVGQPLVVTATATNEGTEAGRKVVQFEVEHEIVDRRNFTLQPNESRTVTFTHVFETPGNKTFEVDSGENRFVTVAERRPQLSVSSVRVAPESVQAGAAVTITALVRNDGYADGSLPVALELFGEVVAVENVTLSTGESAEVSFTRTVYEPGSYEAAVGNETAEFRVVAAQSNGTATTTTTDSVLESAAETPGFGPVAALVGALVAVALALGRRE